MAHLTGSNQDSSRERSRQGKWLTLSRWVASRSSSESSLSSALLKISDREDDEPRGPVEPRPRSEAFRPRRESAKRKLQSETRPSSGTLPRDSSGNKPAEPSPVSSPQPDGTGPSGRRSFWRTSYQPDEDSSIQHTPIGSPGPSGRQPLWRTSYQPDEGSSIYHGPTGSPGPSGRQSFWSRGEDSSGLHRAPPASSTRVSAHSAEKTAPEVEPTDRVSGARQPDASLQHPAGSQPTRSAASTPRHGEPALEPCGKRAATSTSGKNDASRAKPVAEVDRATQGRASSPISRPSKQQKQGTAAKRPVGYRVLKEMARFRAGTRKLIPRLPFGRVARGIVRRHTTGGHDLRMQKSALEALQEASEAVIVAVLEGAALIAHNARRVTIMPRDIETLLTIIRDYASLHSSLYA
nr:proteoglycan 4-like [Dermacentor andersoni]